MALSQLLTTELAICTRINHHQRIIRFFYPFLVAFHAMKVENKTFC